MPSKRPTLFLGKVTVNDDAFNFNDSVVTVLTNPITQDNIVTKAYVDEAVNAQKVRIDDILGGAGGSTDLSLLVAAITTANATVATEISDRVASETILQNKIDMLFKYFFHRGSSGAIMDDQNQILFNN